MKPMISGMPFDKYRGRLRTDMPSGYLRWVLATCALTGALRSRIERELTERAERKKWKPRRQVEHQPLSFE